jgi:hypothetical protein
LEPDRALARLLHCIEIRPILVPSCPFEEIRMKASLIPEVDVVCAELPGAGS